VVFFWRWYSNSIQSLSKQACDLNNFKIGPHALLLRQIHQLYLAIAPTIHPVIPAFAKAPVVKCEEV